MKHVVTRYNNNRKTVNDFNIAKSEFCLVCADCPTMVQCNNEKTSNSGGLNIKINRPIMPSAVRIF